MFYHIVCKTLTNAQRMSKVLSKNGIMSNVRRLPSNLREQNGCGYAIRVDDNNLKPALAMLRDMDIAPLRVYGDLENGGEEIDI